MSDDLLKVIGEAVDQLVTLDVSGRGVIRQLYNAAREQVGAPLCMTGARKLSEVVRPNDVVLIATGMIIHPFTNIGETDGPVGGAGIARALQISLNAKTLFVTDNALIEMITRTARGASLTVVSTDVLQSLQMPLAAVIDFPTKEKEAGDQAKKIIEYYKPKAIVAIERRGVSKNGVYHAWNGYDMAPYEARIGRLYEECKKMGILTIGIGDGGNEIGMGNIYDVVRKVVPHGNTCKCSTKCGIADSTVVDVPIAVTVSNWGAYGIEACLAAISGKIEALHTGEDELRILNECINAGGLDGPAKVPRAYIDALPGRIHASIVDILAEIVRGRFRDIKP